MNNLCLNKKTTWCLPSNHCDRERRCMSCQDGPAKQRWHYDCFAVRGNRTWLRGLTRRPQCRYKTWNWSKRYWYFHQITVTEWLLPKYRPTWLRQSKVKDSAANYWCVFSATEFVKYKQSEFSAGSVISECSISRTLPQSPSSMKNQMAISSEWKVASPTTVLCCMWGSSALLAHSG